MIVQFVKFTTSLSEAEVMAIAEERSSQFRAVPGLIQKYYLKLEGDNRFGGFYVWESTEALAAFRESDLAKTIPGAYVVQGAPEVEIHKLAFPLRDMAEATAQVA